MLRNRAEQDRCYARGGAAGWSLLALTVVELPKFRPNGLRMTLTSTVVSASGARGFWFRHSQVRVLAPQPAFAPRFSYLAPILFLAVLSF
jgi:hypothetical protein